MRTGRPLWWVAGLSLSLLLAAGLLTWVVLDEDSYVAPGPGRAAPSAAPALASNALRALEKAVRSGDVEAAGELAPPDDPAAEQALASLARNASLARVTEFSLRYVTELGGVAPDGSWPASVDATWAFGGFDESPSRAEVAVTFTQADGEGRIVGVGGGDRRTPIWMSGPLEVRRSPTTLVLVAAGAAQADGYDARVRAAVPAVRRVLPNWRARLVVEVPASVEALHQALGSDPGTLDNIAATTVAPDGSLAPDAPIHVFVNPQVFGDQQVRGAQIVMTHEAVHIATEAATSAMPLWLLEGFADYVALSDTDLPDSVTARRVIRQVRREGPPAQLPGPQQFDTGAQHLGAAYEAAWLACRLLADLGGEQGLVRFYLRVRAGEPVRGALARGFGLTPRELAAQWRDLLSDLAA